MLRYGLLSYLRSCAELSTVPRMTAEATGTLIQRARQRKRLTQQELADQLGVNRGSVASWENGKHFPQRYAGAIEDLLEIKIPDPDEAVPA